MQCWRLNPGPLTHASPALYPLSNLSSQFLKVLFVCSIREWIQGLTYMQYCWEASQAHFFHLKRETPLYHSTIHGAPPHPQVLLLWCTGLSSGSCTWGDALSGELSPHSFLILFNVALGTEPRASCMCRCLSLPVYLLLISQFLSKEGKIAQVFLFKDLLRLGR